MLSSVIRTLEIIETISRAKKGLTSDELAKILKTNRSTLHHQLTTLVGMRYLFYNSATRQYDIGLHLIELGQKYLNRLDVRRTAHGHLERLSRDLDEVVNLLILRDNRLVYIDRMDLSTRIGDLRPVFSIGASVPAAATASGKILLAEAGEEELKHVLNTIKLERCTKNTTVDKELLRQELRLTHQRGFGVDDEEHQIGVKCIAVPIFDNRQRAIAAISVSGPASRFSHRYMTSKLLPRLRETAQAISREMGYVAPENRATRS